MNSFFIELNHRDLLAVKGEDSGKFLQGQLTCDVTSASESRFIPGAICNNKGRVLCSFLLLQKGNDYYLEMPKGLLSMNKANLDRYIVFYKAETADARDEYVRIGLAGEAAKQLLDSLFDSVPVQPNETIQIDGHILFMLNEAGAGVIARYELWLNPATAQPLVSQIRETLPAGDMDNWELQDLLLGRYDISQKEVEEYTPQVLNYDLSERVSFTKGCYTGQEIVARMHYRGKPKKRMYTVSIKSRMGSDSLENADVMLAESHKKSGEIVKLIKTGIDSYTGLASLDAAQADTGSTFYLSPDPDSRLEPSGKSA